ncbi:hypothetical protein DINM_006091 [Dirofilaria immitis]|nr:hypothetical protein [Dirofilaria immitis]
MNNYIWNALRYITRRKYELIVATMDNYIWKGLLDRKLLILTTRKKIFESLLPGEGKDFVSADCESFTVDCGPIVYYWNLIEQYPTKRLITNTLLSLCPYRAEYNQSNHRK